MKRRKNVIVLLAAFAATAIVATFALCGCGEDDKPPTSVVVGTGFEIVGGIESTSIYVPAKQIYTLSFTLNNNREEVSADFAFAFYEGERLMYRATVRELAPEGRNAIVLRYAAATEKGKEVVADRIILESVTAVTIA